MLAGFYFAPPPADRFTVLARLTDIAKVYYHPERDLQSYVAGCLVGIVLPVLLLRRESKRQSSVEGVSPGGPWRVRSAATISSVAAAVFLSACTLRFGPDVADWIIVAFRELLGSRVHTSAEPASGLLVLVSAALFLLLGLLAAVRLGRLRTGAATEPGQAGRPSAYAPWRGQIDETGEAPPRATFSWARDTAWFATVALSIAALLAVPDVSRLSGAIFMNGEQHHWGGYHHWDYFAVGPALQVRAGRALGPQAYTQYGSAFPFLLARLDPLVPLRYDNLLRWAIILGCVYFSGLALLLRLLLGDWLWAAAGTLAAVNLQCFVGAGGDVIWLCPSSSVLRYYLDVWFFLSLCLLIRTRKLTWALVCGATAGMAVLWELDTGIYLLCVSVFYSLAASRPPKAAPGMTVEPNGWISSAALLGAASLVALGGTSIISGPLTDRRTVAALFEPIVTYSSGMGCIPMASLETGHIIGFMCVAGVCLWPLSRWLLHRRVGLPCGGDALLRACLGAYGLCALMLFVQRSHPLNLYHGIVPFCVLSTQGLASAADRLLRPMAGTSVFRRGLPAFAVCAALATLPASSSFRAYPGLLQAAVGADSGDPGIPLGRRVGVSGLPQWMAPAIGDFQRVTSRLAALQRAGHKVAILDVREPMYCIESGVPPCDRYCPLIYSLLFRDRLDQALERFSKEHFDYVMVGERSYSPKIDKAFRQYLMGGYQPDEVFGKHTIWRKRLLSSPAWGGPSQTGAPVENRTMAADTDGDRLDGTMFTLLESTEMSLIK